MQPKTLMHFLMLKVTVKFDIFSYLQKIFFIFQNELREGSNEDEEEEEEEDDYVEDVVGMCSSRIKISLNFLLKISLEISSKDLVDLTFFAVIFLFCAVFFLLICLVSSSEIDLSIINSFSGLLSEISVLVI